MSLTPNLQVDEFGDTGVPSGADLTRTMRRLDVVVQLHAIAITTTAPDAPALGDRYIVALAASGVFAGHERHVAYYSQGGWQYLVPEHGWRATVGDALDAYIFDLTIPGWRVDAVEADAIDVSYDNTASGLGATDVQAAIDELATTAASDHGALTGLDDDDHAQYAHLSARSNTFTMANTFSSDVRLNGKLYASNAEGAAGQVLSAQGVGQPAIWRTASGASIDLGWNFDAGTSGNPGAQKLGFNTGAYSTVTAIRFNDTAFNNFDAETIISLLQTGNRIYLQQRNDDKAVVYQVTGTATDNTGYWTVPVSFINSRGSFFPSNADLTVVFILSVSGGAGANPTASVGLTAVNGAATTFMRSDAAPSLDQAIAPTWTASHRWTGDTIRGGTTTLTSIGRIGTTQPGISMTTSGAGTDAKSWEQIVLSPDGTYIVQALDEAVTVGRRALTFERSGVAITGMTYGNSTNYAPHTFLGELRCSHYVRGSGWISNPNGDPNGAAIEIGYVGGVGYVHGYNRSGSSYIPVHVWGSQIDFSCGASQRAALSSAGAWRWHNYGAGTLTTDASGNITATVSDERLKRNIRRFTRGLDALLGLQPILYGYTKESGLDQTREDYAGFSAQNIREWIPEAVGMNADGTLSMSDRPIIAALVNAIRELRDELDALRGQMRSI